MLLPCTVLITVATLKPPRSFLATLSGGVSLGFEVSCLSLLALVV